MSLFADPLQLDCRPVRIGTATALTSCRLLGQFWHCGRKDLSRTPFRYAGIAATRMSTMDFPGGPPGHSSAAAVRTASASSRKEVGAPGLSRTSTPFAGSASASCGSVTASQSAAGTRSRWP